MTEVSLAVANRRFAAFAAQAALGLLVFAAEPAFAQQMIGQDLLTFAGNYIIGPLGIFAVIIALAGSIFRPDLVKGAIYAAIICAVLFFIIKMAPQLITAFKG